MPQWQQLNGSRVLWQENNNLEKPVSFICNNKKLYGILHEPDNNSPIVIVIMVVGGYQTRYGSHRLYIKLARYLTMHGHGVLRFDCEGKGDSSGDFVGLRNAALSIDAAVDYMGKVFYDKKIIIWSLCDGSSASAIYAYEKPEKIAGLILSNTYVSTEKSYATANLKYYYVSRLKKRKFWKKLLSFKVDLKKSLEEIGKALKKTICPKKELKQIDKEQNSMTLPELVLLGMSQLGKPIVCIIANEDILAKEFYGALKKDKRIKQLLSKKKIKCQVIKGADHTFDQPAAQKELFDVTLQALNGYF